ncbi:Lysylphosphatidylglycerol synthase TM region [uncultured archaeon]|nr:Lysylphosphatidylglycerol synthase TM region [uncultured archaeon]
MKWATIKKYLPLIGIGLFIYLLVRLDVAKVFQEFNSIKWDYIAISLVFVAIFFILQTLKWFVIARKQKINVPFGEAFKINLIANFYGFVTPGKIGTIIRTDYLKRKGTETGKGLSNFVIDKIMDICSLFALVAIFGFLRYKKLIPDSYLYLMIGIFAVIILLFLVFYKKENSRFFLRIIYRRFIPNRLKEKSRVLFNSFYEDLPSLPFLSFVFLINIITWIMNYVIIYLVGLSLGINVKFIYFLMILPVATLVAQIPITINGFGTRELTMIGLFGILEVSAVKVFSMSIFSIIITNIIPCIIAIIILLLDKKNEIHNIKTSG